MSPDSDGLHAIANTDHPAKRADIVFVHGLGGGSHTTWTYGKPGKSEHFYWPEALGQDLPDCAIWSIGYPAGITALGQQGMIIEKRAGNLAQKLVNAGLGQHPILFICHSMGGLVVKHLVTDSATLPGDERKRLVQQICGIVFCGTPHRGAGFADAARILAILAGGSQAHVREMCANEDRLDLLHDKFIAWQQQRPIAILSYAENQPLRLTRWFFLSKDYGIVVPRASANPGIPNAEIHDVDDDHLSLVKPPHRQHDVYSGVRGFVDKALSVAKSISAEKSHSVPSVNADDLSSNPLRTNRSLSEVEANTGFDFAQPADLLQKQTLNSTTLIDISRIDRYAPKALLGRTAELALLNDAWEQTRHNAAQRPRVLAFVALGGEGKTSLVARWAAELLGDSASACTAAFAWSFYSQGTREQSAVSADAFLREALVFFGDSAMADSNSSAQDKGQRLSQLIGAQRALLILDGLEPLQYPPTAPLKGELKDQGLVALLKSLALRGQALCIVTTRYSLPDLHNYPGAVEQQLKRLSSDAGVALLKALGVKHGAATDFAALVETVRGHALTLHLLGSYLHDAHAGDIRKAHLVKLEEANSEIQHGHAFHVMDAYVAWLHSGDTLSQRALALLRLLGLFDRPASADCLAALQQAPLIPDLNETLVNLSSAQYNLVLTRLESAKLLNVNRDSAGNLLSVDAHPLLREYFANALREHYPAAWQAAHRRLYEHLCAFTPDKPAPTLEDLQPLYQAVAHGCLAGLQQETCDKVYCDRILRGTGDDGFYSWKKLGAFASDLGAIASFFVIPWQQVAPALREDYQAWLLNEAAVRLRGLGRLREALEPMRAGLEMRVKQENWKQAAISAGNLSELELLLGDIAAALSDAEQSVSHAERSGDAFMRMASRTILADALHQAGRRAEAEALFRDAEAMQAEWQPAYPRLCSLPGFRYCDLLLAEAERDAWLVSPRPLGQIRQERIWSSAARPEGSGQDCAETLGMGVRAAELALQANASCTASTAGPHPNPFQEALVISRERGGFPAGRGALIAACHAVTQRAIQTLQWAEQSNVDILSIALDHLTLARAALYSALLEHGDFQAASEHSAAAVDGLRRAGQLQELPKALLTRAWLRGVSGDIGSAQTDLDEAQEIAERGPMPLYLADIHLYRARLFAKHQPYPWTSPAQDLSSARQLIETHRYLRRLQELQDAEQ